jgi:hypothetical protein
MHSEVHSEIHWVQHWEISLGVALRLALEGWRYTPHWGKHRVCTRESVRAGDEALGSTAYPA